MATKEWDVNLLNGAIRGSISCPFRCSSVSCEVPAAPPEGPSYVLHQNWRPHLEVLGTLKHLPFVKESVPKYLLQSPLVELTRPPSPLAGVLGTELT